MSIDSVETKGPGPNQTLRQSWLLVAAVLAGVSVVFIALYYASIASAVTLWATRATYNHGFIILPISLYLVWERRTLLASLKPTPSVLGLLVVAGFGLAWLVASAAGIAEGQHLALVGMIQGFLLAILGLGLFRTMLLPIMYLWLMVPTGGFLYPVLQSVATYITAQLLLLSQVPTYVEGFDIHVSVGLFHIAEGCAGLNFILASLALAPLYAYFMYQSMIKRIAAVAVMVVVAMIANGVRIYAIIALAQFTDRKIDIVDDHLVYGWGFFALVLLATAWVGMRYADKPEPDPTPLDLENKPAFAVRPLVFTAMVTLGLLAAFPGYLAYGNGPHVEPGQLNITLAPKPGTWAKVEAGSSWRPSYPSAQGTYTQEYERDGARIGLFVAYFEREQDGAELISSGNHLFDPEVWHQVSNKTLKMPEGLEPRRLSSLLVSSGQKDQTISYTYWLGGSYEISNSRAKVAQALARLTLGDRRAAMIATSVLANDTSRTDAEILQEFWADLASLDAALEGAHITPLATE